MKRAIGSGKKEHDFQLEPSRKTSWKSEHLSGAPEFEIHQQEEIGDEQCYTGLMPIPRIRSADEWKEMDGTTV